MIEKIKNIFNKTKHKDMMDKDIINDYKAIHRSGGFVMGNPKLDISFYAIASDNDELINGNELYNRAINYLAKDRVKERDHNLYYDTIIDTINYEFDINDNRTIKFINDEFNRILNEVKSIDKYYIEYKCDIIHSEKCALFEFFEIKENDLEKTREIILNIINYDKGFRECIKNNELIKKLIRSNYSLDFIFEENKNDNINEYCLKLGIRIFCNNFDYRKVDASNIKLCYKKHDEELIEVHSLMNIK